MRELWARRIAVITGIVVILLAVIFSISQNPQGELQMPTTAYIGSSACKNCHADEFRAWSRSGHAFMLNTVRNGKPPRYPFTRVPQPPHGYQWKDIRYVVGGYHWRARFVDQRGYLLMGSAAQYNFANPALGKQAAWVAYEEDKQDKSFDCGHCHTTGYSSEAEVDGLPGIKGGWSEPGIGCENCHGPGRQHARVPTTAMHTNRSSDACGACHYREPTQDISMAKGFIRHHQQFNALRQGKHAGLSCNDCHDPHKGVIAERKANRPGVHRACNACHQNIADENQTKPVHRGLTCMDCHMPRLDVIAWSDTDHYAGDMRTHVLGIDLQATSQAVEKQGKTVSIPGITLDYACRGCHRRNGPATDLPDDTLRKFAQGIHAVPNKK